MKIVFEYDAVLPVKKYGGVERIIFWLMKEYVKRGHEVYYIGPEGCELKEIGVNHILRPNVISNLASVIPDDADIIHLTYRPDPAWNLKIPYIITTHGNGKPGEEFDLNTVFLSKKHASLHNSDVFVYNGIDFDEYPYFERKALGAKDYKSFMFLAKVSWKVKNIKDCIKACKKQKKILHITGGKKLCFSPLIKNLGFVDQEQKIATMKNSDAFLWPVRWHEPFGVAVIEAMALGMPVISSPYGSLKELISPESGIICKSYQEFEDTIGNIGKSFEPKEIRKYAEEKFSIIKCADNYLELYEKIINGQKLNTEKPKTLSQTPPESLLPF